MGPKVSRMSEVCPRARVRFLVAHRVNDPAKIRDVLVDGANGIEIDLCSDNINWFVNHSKPNGHRLEWYMGQLRDLAKAEPAVFAHLALVYFDIKTPSASNLPELGKWIAEFPSIQFLFGVASHSEELLRLPINATLAIDLALHDDVKRVTERMDHADRTYWLGDGFPPGLPKPSMSTSMQQFTNETKAQGTFAWTYSHLGKWCTDMATHGTTMTTVEPALVRKAARILSHCAFNPECEGDACVLPEDDWRVTVRPLNDRMRIENNRKKKKPPQHGSRRIKALAGQP